MAATATGEFSITGHPDGGAVDLWCVYGNGQLSDNVMHGFAITANGASKLSNVTAVSDGTRLYGYFERTLRAPTADDVEFAVDAPMTLVWARSDMACNACLKHGATGAAGESLVRWSAEMRCAAGEPPAVPPPGRLYENCRTISERNGVSLAWTLNADATISVRFAGRSSGYLCVGITDLANSFPTVRSIFPFVGHPRGPHDVWCAYGQNLSDSIMRDQTVSVNGKRSLKDVTVSSRNGMIVASFTRALKVCGPRGRRRRRKREIRLFNTRNIAILFARARRLRPTTTIS